MSHINTVPNVYNSTTFVDCDWSFVNIREKIELILRDFNHLQSHYVQSMRAEYSQQYDPTNLVIRTHKWLSKLDGYGTE